MTGTEDSVGTDAAEGWSAAAYGTLAVAAAFVVGSTANQLLASAASGQPALARLAVQYLGLHGAGFLGVSALYMYLRRLGFGYLRLRSPELDDVGWTAAVTATVVALAYGLFRVYDHLGVGYAEHSVDADAAGAPELYLVLVALSLVLIGPAEELMFRGVLQNAFAESTSTGVAVAAASVVFAAVHVGSVSGSPVEVAAYLFAAFALSLVLGYSYVAADSLLVPATAHGVYNAVVFYLAYLGAV